MKPTGQNFQRSTFNVQRSTVLPLLCFLSCLLFIGCSVTRGHRATDGTLTVSNYRLLWSSEAVDFSVTQPNALTARLKIGKSATDDQAVAAITAGVVKGLTRP